MRFPWIAIAALSGAFVLAGCGNDAGQSGGMQTALGILKDRMPTGAAAMPAPAISRAALGGFANPLLRGQIAPRGVDALLGIDEINGSDVTWRSSDGVSLTLRRGVLVATRGLGEDLMSADVPDVTRSGPGGLRYHFYLGGDEKIHRVTMKCGIALQGTEVIEVLERRHSTRHLTETCTYAGGTIRNDYWIGTGGNMRKSRQWVSETVGYLTLERVVDG